MDISASSGSLVAFYINFQDHICVFSITAVYEALTKSIEIRLFFGKKEVKKFGEMYVHLLLYTVRKINIR